MRTLKDETMGGDNSLEGPRCSGVVVLGSGRSGTSAISRAFVFAGFFAGREEDLLGANFANQTGHYEPLPVLALNEELLGSLGWAWWAGVPPLDEQHRLRAEAEPRFAAVLGSLHAAAEGAPLVVKEPRINTLLPLWWAAIESALHPVLAIRDPVEIAQSLDHRDGISPAHTLASWEVQTALMLEYLDGREVTVAPYGEMIASDEIVSAVVAGAAEHIRPEAAERIGPERAGEALRPDLRHESGRAVTRELLTVRQNDLWTYLRALAPGNSRLAVPDRLKGPTESSTVLVQKENERHQLLAEHVEFGAQLTATREAEAAERGRRGQIEAELAAYQVRSRRYEQEIRAVEGSISWRLTKPLRHAKQLALRRQR